MFIVDVQSLPNHASPPIAFQSLQKRPDVGRMGRTIGLCRIVPNGPDHDPNSAEQVFEPLLAMKIYFRINEHREVADQGRVVILLGPKHGMLNGEEDGTYRYVPNSGYFGHDQATMLLEMDGIRIKLIYFFQSIQAGALGNTTYADLCGEKAFGWRLRTAAVRHPRRLGETGTARRKAAPGE